MFTFRNYLHIFSFKTPSKRAESSEQKCTDFASSIRNGVKYFYKYYIFPFIQIKNVYPFELMDSFLEDEYLEYRDSYVITEQFEETPPQPVISPDKNMQIVQKICESIQLDNSDYIYLESLSKPEIMKFVRLYNDNLYK